MRDLAYQFAQLSNAIERQVGSDRFAVGLVGCEEGVGTTSIARGFAEYLDRRQPTTCVYVETDWRVFEHAKNMPSMPMPGLSEVVLGHAQLKDALCSAADSAGYSILHSGNAAALSCVEAPALHASGQTILTTLRERFRRVVVDIAPLGTETFASVLAPLLDGLILVIECETSRWEVADATVESINAIGGKIVGAVLNKKRYHIPTWLYRLL